MQPTKTPKTKGEYLKIVESIRQRFLRDRAIKNGTIDIFNRVSTDEDDEPMTPERADAEYRVFVCTNTELIEWLIATSNEQIWKSTTIRLRRAALVYYLETERAEVESRGRKDEIDLIKEDHATAFSQLQQWHTAGNKLAPKRGPAKKKKSITLPELVKLRNHLWEAKGRWAGRTLRMLIGGITAGLRPSEWMDAEAIRDPATGNLSLKVRNAKATNGRACGEFRTLTFHRGYDADAIEDQIYERDTYFEEDPNAQWSDYINVCAATLYRANKKLWPKNEKHVTLYTSRHQFSANMKANGGDPLLIAELMGHASEDTAAEHYGKRRSGWKAPGAKRDTPEVEITNRNPALAPRTPVSSSAPTS